MRDDLNEPTDEELYQELVALGRPPTTGGHDTKVIITHAKTVRTENARLLAMSGAGGRAVALAR